MLDEWRIEVHHNFESMFCIKIPLIAALNQKNALDHYSKSYMLHATTGNSSVPVDQYLPPSINPFSNYAPKSEFILLITVWSIMNQQIVTKLCRTISSNGCQVLHQ